MVLSNHLKSVKIRLCDCGVYPYPWGVTMVPLLPARESDVVADWLELGSKVKVVSSRHFRPPGSKVPSFSKKIARLSVI